MPSLRREWTADDLDDLPDDGNRYEVIDGELFVTPAPALLHQRAIVELWKILDEYARRTGIGYAIVAPADIRFSQRRQVQPDVFVIPPHDGRLPRKFSDVGRLLLAAEVLSPSTARADRVKKRKLFREEQVPEYWIVDLDARAFERSTPDNVRPELIDDRLEWLPDGAAGPLVIDVAAYFAAVIDG